MVGIFFFLNKRIHLQYSRLAVAFGRYAYAANKFLLGANSTLGTRGFSRVRREFSLLAEGRHIFGRTKIIISR